MESPRCEETARREDSEKGYVTNRGLLIVLFVWHTKQKKQESLPHAVRPQIEIRNMLGIG